MKKILFLFLSLTLWLSVKSQTFYEVRYFDALDSMQYLGLMTYWDNENITVRFLQDDDNQGDEISYWECNYACEFEKKGKVNYMIFKPIVKRDKASDGAYPYFIWTWTKKDASDQSESPFVVFDMKQFGDDMQTAEYFEEISLDDMDAEYVEQFYDKDEKMYSVIIDACKLVREQDGNVSTSVGSNDAITMHFIMVAATMDESIGESVETDIKLVEPEFKKFAEQLKIGYDEQIISGNAFCKANVEKALNKLNPNPNDIVVFVYSGHGFRFDDDTDDYPNMFLTYGSADDMTADDYIGVSDIFNSITSKKPRLTIVISDCCNSKFGVTRQEVESSALAARGNKSYDLAKLKKLFIDSYGNMKVTAAKAGQVALCDARGGYLLTSFLSNLHSQISAVSDKTPSWQTIIENSREYVKRKTTGFDEAGRDRDPQIVVRSVSVKTKNSEGELEEEAIPASFSSDINRNDQTSEDDDWLLGLLCIFLPIIIIIVLIVIIIRIMIKRNKNNRNIGN